MKLIIESLNGELYIYKESEKQFKKTEQYRATRRRNLSDLENECLIDLDENFHYVVPMGKERKK